MGGIFSGCLNIGLTICNNKQTIYAAIPPQLRLPISGIGYLGHNAFAYLYYNVFFIKQIYIYIWEVILDTTLHILYYDLIRIFFLCY